jgi:hypothetical protein
VCNESGATEGQSDSLVAPRRGRHNPVVPVTFHSERTRTGLDGTSRTLRVAVFGRHVTEAFLVGAFALQAAGCATPQQSMTAYEGKRLAPNADERVLPRFDALPPQALVLGTVTAACDRASASGPSVSVRLVALVCSPSWLAVAVDERARSVGGTALHRFTCNVSESATDQVERAECTAEVLSGSFPAMTTQAPPLRRAYRPSSVLSALVEYRGVVRQSRGDWGNGGSPMGPATEVPSMPASDRALGSLRVRVSEPGGTSEDARAALLLAAAALGGTHVVAPTCLTEPSGAGFSCTAVTTAPDVEGAR